MPDRHAALAALLLLMCMTATAACPSSDGDPTPSPRDPTTTAPDNPADTDATEPNATDEAPPEHEADGDGEAPTPAEAPAKVTSAADTKGAGGGDAPERLEGVFLRASWPLRAPYGDLCYEGNNIAMRGPKGDGGNYDVDGEALAKRWREVARQVRCVFVLRDSLFSQQDHPYRHPAHALMMPPNWITVAVGAAQGGEALEVPAPPPEADDAAWEEFGSPTDLFGSFPPSESLYKLATRSTRDASAPDRAQTLNARRAVRALAEDAEALAAATKEGPEAAARVGAGRIAAGDVAYFGQALRRRSVIPIFVENPTPHELEEGKGLLAPRHPLATEAAARLVRRVLYRRRLRDGDLAVERYDISRPDERARAVATLEALIPAGEGGHVVWLWVTGPLDPDKKLQGEDAVAYVDALRKDLEGADIEARRLRLVSKPDPRLPRDAKGRARAIERALARFEAADLPLGLNLQGPDFARAVKAMDAEE